MNNSLLKILLFLLIPAIGFSQETEFGAKTGFNLSTLTGDEASSFDAKIGPALSAFVKVPLTSTLTLQPELQFGPYGAKSSDNGDDRILMNQVNFPIKVSYYTGANGTDDGLFVNAGPQIGFTVFDRFETGGENFDLNEYLESIDGRFEAVDFGATLNVGYEFDFGLWVEGGAYHSITPVFEFQNDEKNYNGVANLTIGFNFNALDD